MALRPDERMTYDEYTALPDDGLRRQVIDGKVFVTPSPNIRHQNLVLDIGVAIRVYLRAHNGGQVFVSPCDVVLSEYDVVQPDVIFVADDRIEVVTTANIRGVPTLVIEVVSDSRMDRVRKRDLYAAAGIPTYWIVDPDADRIEVYRLAGDSYAPPVIFESGSTLGIDELAGFALDLTALFQR
ncbi:MAG: hypothetical protein NVSMB57_17000 [Actinomycetota bacterium]